MKEGKCLRWRAKPAHLVGYLPAPPRHCDRGAIYKPVLPHPPTCVTISHTKEEAPTLTGERSFFTLTVLSVIMRHLARSFLYATTTHHLPHPPSINFYVQANVRSCLCLEEHWSRFYISHDDNRHQE